jgi:hypothetical protein
MTEIPPSPQDHAAAGRPAAPMRETLARKNAPGPGSARLSRLWRSPQELGIVTYSIAAAAGASEQAPRQDKRRDPRRRTRLRAGKILDRANRFIVDATILDRSCGGLRLRLARQVAIPEIFHFYDDESESVFIAKIAWRAQAQVGARRGPGVATPLRLLMALRGKYYGMRD